MILTMTNYTKEKLVLPPCKGRMVEAEFIEKEVTSDGGVLLLREIDRKINLTGELEKIIPDFREPTKIKHSLISMLKQRIYGIALGYEDLNDHTTLRNDPALQTSVDREGVLASSPTLCRMENKANRKMIFDSNKLMVEKFIESFIEPPPEIILDFDATEDEVHGHQENRHFHGYYSCYCFLPLHVFCGNQLLISYLRPSNIDGAKHAWGILSLLVKRIRKSWPNVKITFRGDSGFCRNLMLRWCERKEVTYIVGIAQNSRLNKFSEEAQKLAEEEYNKTKEKQRIFSEFKYAAGSWKEERRVIAKSEHTDKGANPRYIVTNEKNFTPQELYEKHYCSRGDMENRIKEIKRGVFSDRTSCHEWWPNQLRLIFSSMAYILMERMRRIALRNTELATAQCETIRLKLYKIGAIILRNTRRIRFLLSNNYPKQALFLETAKKLCPG
jgi:Transposase DDE domain group 1